MQMCTITTIMINLDIFDERYTVEYFHEIRRKIPIYCSAMTFIITEHYLQHLCATYFNIIREYIKYNIKNFVRVGRSTMSEW